MNPLVAVLCGMAILALAGCGGGGSDPTGPGGGGGSTNHAPTVSINTNTTHLAYGGNATVTVSATDADGDQLTYGYVGTRGTVASSGPTATSATFTAGVQWGPASVTVTVSDGKGGSTQATASMYIRNPAPPHLCIRPGTACPSTFKLGLYPAEAIVVTSVYAYNTSFTQCTVSKDYGVAGVTIGRNALYSFDDLSCPTCPSDPENNYWNVTIQGRRPEPDGGAFQVQLSAWDPTDSGFGPCN